MLCIPSLSYYVYICHTRIAYTVVYAHHVCFSPPSARPPPHPLHTVFACYKSEFLSLLKGCFVAVTECSFSVVRSTVLDADSRGQIFGGSQLTFNLVMGPFTAVPSCHVPALTLHVHNLLVHNSYFVPHPPTPYLI